MPKIKEVKLQKEKKSPNRKKIAIPKNIENNDEKFGKLAFAYVDHHSRCKISDLNGAELKILIETFKKIESIKWSDLLKDSGLNFERNKNINIQLPKNLPKDISFSSFRISKKFRIYGYRVQEYFYIVWFDKNHVVCPENKNKKYTA